jgi:methylase of polypeptide subunit release factors
MTAMEITSEDLKLVTDRSGLFRLLRNKLEWPSVDPLDPFTYDVRIEERDVKANVSQIVPFGADDPYPVMLVETNGEFKRSQLREILRGVRADMRNRARFQGKSISNIIFIVASNGYQDMRFCRFIEQEGRQPRLQAFGWTRGEEGATRTLREVNLPALKMPAELPTGGWDWDAKTWQDAWNVDKVQKEFFQGLKAVFEKYLDVIVLVNGTKKDQKLIDKGEEVARLMLQTVINRLLFLALVQKKGWLIPPGTQSEGRAREYLFALYDGASPQVNDFDFHERMRQLFFQGLCEPDEKIRKSNANLQRIGSVPYLHGSLFEAGKYEQQSGEYADLGWIKLPNGFYGELIGPDGVFRKFNFTISESTPDDVEVAVDPEMLGLVFEELMTLREAQESSRRRGDDPRHATGSYYTPRNIVQFMCREALKVYLAPFADRVDIGALVDRHTLSGEGIPLAQLKNAVEKIKVCDPACGSGAYLVGMLHELNEVLKVLDSRISEGSADAARSDYKRKLILLQNAIYGVDLQEFAVNMAQLRFWLSVAVDMVEPNPLPNLDYKIGFGDTLLAPDPSSAGDLFLQAIHKEADLIGQLKKKYSDPFDTSNKAELKRQIDEDLAALRKTAEDNAPCPKVAFDWRVEFAEVFVERDGTAGGFDIVLANPPYVRNEDIEEATKSEYVRMYADVVTRRSDLYCSFYARALQLTRPGGVDVFVCSNSWLDVDFGGPLQRHLLLETHILKILDSAYEKQFTSAEINTIISFCQKISPLDKSETAFVQLRAPFDDAIDKPELRREIRKIRANLWIDGLGEPDRRGRRDFEGDKWGGKYFRAPDVYWRILEKSPGSVVPLGTVSDVNFGNKTGANDFFYVRVVSRDNMQIRVRCDDHIERSLGPGCQLEPAFVKSREVISPRLSVNSATYSLVRLKESSLKEPDTQAYVNWGESRGFDQRPSTRGRTNWFALQPQPFAAVAMPMAYKRRSVVAWIDGNAHLDARFYAVYPHTSDIAKEWGKVIAASLLATFSMISREVNGRANFGQGMLDLKVYEAKRLPIISLNSSNVNELLEAFEAICDRRILMIYDEVRREDRRRLDDAFLQCIGFDNPVERSEVLEELQDQACRMVWSRQAKAGNTREARQTYDDWVASGQPFGDAGDEEIQQ